MGRRRRKGKGQRKPKLHRDDKGEFRWETYFDGGKQKRTKVRTVDGIDADEFWRQNVDPIALHQAGEYELLHALEEQWWPSPKASSGRQLELALEYSDADIDIPF